MSGRSAMRGERRSAAAIMFAQQHFAQRLRSTALTWGADRETVDKRGSGY
jgi:hypothetical protein